MSIENKCSKLKVFLDLTFTTVVIFLNYDSSYLEKLPFSNQDTAHLNEYDFPSSCWARDVNPFNEIAMIYANASQERLKPRYGECDLMSSKGTVVFEDLSKNPNEEEYLLRINPEYILKREKLNRTEKNELECSVVRVEKMLDEIDRWRNLRYVHLGYRKVNLSKVGPLEFNLNMSGYFQIKCLQIIDGVVNKTRIYQEMLWIYPANLKLMVDRHAVHRETTKKRLKEIEKFDSKENPMTYDVPYDDYSS
jgi:hypothetical protein